MIYICYRKGSKHWTTFEVEEFKTEKEALDWLQTKPRTRMVGIFSGKRLEMKIGQKKVTKSVAIGFNKAKTEE